MQNGWKVKDQGLEVRLEGFKIGRVTPGERANKAGLPGKVVLGEGFKKVLVGA